MKLASCNSTSPIKLYFVQYNGLHVQVNYKLQFLFCYR